MLIADYVICFHEFCVIYLTSALSTPALTTDCFQQSPDFPIPFEHLPHSTIGGHWIKALFKLTWKTF